MNIISMIMIMIIIIMSLMGSSTYWFYDVRLFPYHICLWQSHIG